MVHTSKLYVIVSKFFHRNNIWYSLKFSALSYLVENILVVKEFFESFATIKNYSSSTLAVT